MRQRFRVLICLSICSAVLATSAVSHAQNGNDLGAAIIQGLIQGAAAAERDRQRDERYGNYNDYGPQQQQQQYIQQQPVAPAAPAAPPKPKPEMAGPYAVRSYQPNKLIAPPVMLQATLRNQLIKDLDAVNLAQLETINEVLRSANISDIAIRKLVADAKKGAGAGLDAELLRDLQRAAAGKDATKVEELGAALSLPDDALEAAVLATFVGELQRVLENALDPSDRRAAMDVEKSVRKFQKKLRRSALFEKDLRDGLVEKLQSMVAIVEARQELSTSVAMTREAPNQELTWPTGDVWVLAIPSLKPGSVYYATSNLLLAGTSVPGMATVMRATVGSAIGCVTYEQVLPVAAKGSAFTKPTRVTFINPPSTGRTFKYQLNGYDYELASGAMQHFKNSASNKIETFRYSGADGNTNLGFNLTRDGELITEQYFILGWNGTNWTVGSERSPAFISAVIDDYTVPETCLINDSDRALTIKFNGATHTLPSGALKHFDKVTDWRMECSVLKGEKAYTLAAGRGFRFKNVDGGIGMFTAQASTLTIDNSANAVPFTYALGNRWQTVDPYRSAQHSFAVPPLNLAVSFDQGQGKLVTTSVRPTDTYYVGITPGMNFALATDSTPTTLPLDGQRKIAMQKEKRLMEMAEALAERRATENLNVTNVRPDNPVRRGDDAQTQAQTPNRPQKTADAPNRPETSSSRSRLPSAHILAVGVSKYENSEFNLKYADNDAKEFASVFEKSAKTFFGSVTTQLLINKDATKLNIEKALDEITKTVDESDLVVLFFSAHGLSDDKRFYLCTHNVDPAQLISTAVKYNDIVDAVQTLKGRDCRVLLLADTCNSGVLGEALGKKSLADKTLFQAHKDYSTSGAGAVLLASSADGHSSIERDEWQHGAFTKALLDSIADSDTDVDADGVLYLDEIVGAARRRLRKMTDNKQRLPVSWPSEIQDFPLMKVAK